MLLQHLTLRSLLLVALPLAYADVEFTSPAAGTTVPVGPLEVAWKNSGLAPAIAELSGYGLELMVGGNEVSNSLPIQSFAIGRLFSNGSSVTQTIDPGIAGTVQNGFFFRITSTSLNTGVVINYSDRFTITGLTGVTPSLFRNAALALNGNTNGPPRGGNAQALTSSTPKPTSSATKNPGQTITVTAATKLNPTSALPQTHSDHGSSLSMSAIAGIVVGVLILVISLFSLAAWLLLRRRRRNNQYPRPEIKIVRSQDSVTTLSELSAEGKVVEIGAGIPPPEMDSTTIRAELEGDLIQWPSPRTPSRGNSFGPNGTWGRTLLTPISPSVTEEETLRGTFDYLGTPTTPSSRI